MIHNTLNEAFQWRYAVKRFDPSRKISDADWKSLEDSLRFAPSSYGIQPYKFLVIQNPELREKLKAVSWNQTQVTDSSHYVVMLYREKIEEKDVQKYIDHIANVRKVPHEALNGFKDMMMSTLTTRPDVEIWSQRQPYIAMGFLLETAALLKIDACPMEGFDAAEYNRLLGLEGSGYKAVATVALGYRHAEDGMQHAQKVRFESKDVIQFVS